MGPLADTAGGPVVEAISIQQSDQSAFSAAGGFADFDLSVLPCAGSVTGTGFPSTGVFGVRTSAALLFGADAITDAGSSFAAGFFPRFGDGLTAV